MPSWFLPLFLATFVLTAVYNLLTVRIIFYIGSRHEEQAEEAGLPTSLFTMSFQSSLKLLGFLFKGKQNFNDVKLAGLLSLWRTLFVLSILGFLAVFGSFFYLFALAIQRQ